MRVAVCTTPVPANREPVETLTHITKILSINKLKRSRSTKSTSIETLDTKNRGLYPSSIPFKQAVLLPQLCHQQHIMHRG
jgi:hypothetical protein